MEYVSKDINQGRPIIFVDIDGVLNNFYSIHGTFLEEREIHFDERNRARKRFINSKDILGNFINRTFYFDIDKIILLNKIVRESDANIVISSSLRVDENVVKYLVARGFLFPDRVIGLTPCGDDHRGVQIKEWIEENNFKGNFIILDDDTSDIDPYFNRKKVFKVKGLNEHYTNSILRRLVG